MGCTGTNTGQLDADEFEVERHDLLNRINLCQASAAENHSLRVEIQKRAEEVRELQQALSSAHIHLFEERDRLLQLQAENDALRLQDVENKRRLQHLTSMVEDSQPKGDFSCRQTQSAKMSGIVYPPKAKGTRGTSHFIPLPCRLFTHLLSTGVCCLCRMHVQPRWHRASELPTCCKWASVHADSECRCAEFEGREPTGSVSRTTTVVYRAGGSSETR